MQMMGNGHLDTKRQQLFILTTPKREKQVLVHHEIVLVHDAMATGSL